MAELDSLLVQAQRLSAVARAKKENERDSQTEGQVATALNKLNAATSRNSAMQLWHYRDGAREGRSPVSAVPGPEGSVLALKSHVGYRAPVSPVPDQALHGPGRNVKVLQSATERRGRTGRAEQIDALES